MPSLASRVTVIERLAGRLVAARDGRVSEMLRAARAGARQGGVPPPALHDVEFLTREGGKPGTAGAMARARLRAARGVPQDLSLPVPRVRQDGRGAVGGQENTLAGDRASTPPVAAPTAVSLVDRIDQLVGRYGT